MAEWWMITPSISAALLTRPLDFAGWHEGRPQYLRHPLRGEQGLPLDGCRFRNIVEPVRRRRIPGQFDGNEGFLGRRPVDGCQEKYCHSGEQPSRSPTIKPSYGCPLQKPPLFTCKAVK
jgi:hypothetical protein